MSEIFVISLLEYLGAFIRYAIMYLINKLRSTKTKPYNYYLGIKSNNTYDTVNNDYGNGIIGFLTSIGVLSLLYFIDYTF